MLPWVAALVLVAGAALSLYHFVWPMVGGREQASSHSLSVSPPTSSAPPPVGGSQTTRTSTETETSAGPPGGSATTEGREPLATDVPPSSSVPPPPDVAPSPDAPPSTTRTAEPPPSERDRGRALLESGDFSSAGSAFLDELSKSGVGKFTIAVGLYCNEDNVSRVFSTVSDGELYILPATIEGRRCYRVAWGLFASREAASAAMSTLPNGINAGDAAPIAVSRLLR